MMKVHAIGTKVKVEGIEMTIMAIRITGNPPKATYECTWANGREIKEQSFYEWQLGLNLIPHMQIGFLTEA